MAEDVKLCTHCRFHRPVINTGQPWPLDTKVVFCGSFIDLAGPEARRACGGKLWLTRPSADGGAS